MSTRESYGDVSTSLKGTSVSELTIGIIIGSTRPGRNGEQVARWALEQAQQRDSASYELVDLLDFNLPHLDEAIPASVGMYQNDHTKAWAAKINELDGFVFVTPEYNHSTSGALKNAIDFIYAEWNNKAAGLLSYGSAGGTRAAEHLRLILGELQVADVRAQVSFNLGSDFEGYKTLKPEAAEAHVPQLTAMLDQVESWAGALKTVRAGALAEAA
jgi:NAD(P)H-dependent FMN reductase